MVETMIECGLEIECHHHEVATAGQCEIDQRFDTLVKSADNMMLYKYIVKNVAYQYGKTVTFMPKPLFGDNGSGMHVHQSLWKDGKPLFAGDLYAGLSQMALWYIGGLLKHARALSAIIAPTTNSYKRLVPGYEAPVNLAYSRRNRSAAVRIPMYSASPKAKRVEFRPPDPSANPYLAFASMMMAGLDGVMNKIDPGDSLDKDIYDLSPEEMKRVPSMPGSLDEALNCLEDDHNFLLRGDVFTEDLIETYISYKRKNEADQVRLRPIRGSSLCITTSDREVEASPRTEDPRTARIEHRGRAQITADFGAVHMRGQLRIVPIALDAIRLGHRAGEDVERRAWGVFALGLVSGSIGKRHPRELEFLRIEGFMAVALKRREMQIRAGLRSGTAWEDPAIGIHHHVLVEVMASAREQCCAGRSAILRREPINPRSIERAVDFMPIEFERKRIPIARVLLSGALVELMDPRLDVCRTDAGIIPAHVKRSSDSELVNAEGASEFDGPVDLVSVVLERQELPIEDGIDAALASLGFDQALNVGEDRFEISVLAESLIDRLGCAVDRQGHEIEAGKDIGLSVEPLERQVGRKRRFRQVRLGFADEFGCSGVEQRLAIVIKDRLNRRRTVLPQEGVVAILGKHAGVPLKAVKFLR